MYSSRRGTWSYNVKNIFIDVDCQDLFYSTNPCDIESIQDKLHETDSTFWDIGRYKSEKLRYYNMFKFNKECEEYIKLSTTKYQRSLLAQFRCGILPIEIELGRFRNLSLCDRICPVCSRSVEDEIHFLCQCPLYTEIRNTLFKRASEDSDDFIRMDVFDKFVYLMSNQQRNVMKYLVKAIPLRTSCLYNDTS